MSKTRSRRETLAWLGLIAGLAAIALLVAWNGADTIARIIAVSGWSILLLTFYFVPDLMTSAWSWQLLFRPGRVPPLLKVMEASWMGSSVNSLLPVASVGGEVVKARQIMRSAGVTGPAAGASVVVDKLVQALTVLLWGLIGLALLVALTSDSEVTFGASVGFALFAVGVAGFFLVQRVGVFGPVARAAASMTNRAFWHGLAGSAADLDREIRACYGRLSRFALSCTIKLSGRAILATEVWVAALLMGHEMPILHAIMIRALSITVRAVAFAIPAGLGAQEGTFIAVGALLGYPPELMLAISLATRIREVVPYVPGLLAWQIAEGRHFWRRRVAPATTQPPAPPVSPESR